HNKVMAYHGTIGILEPLEMDDLSPKKVRALTYYTNWRYLSNALLMCYFVSWSYNHLTELVKAVTGWNTSIWELMKAGERISTMARVFNIREGLTETDDWLPDRFFEPHTSGALSETAIHPDKLKSAINTYYKMMGWDEKGIPTEAKLGELEIDWAT
ncbi:MAG: aldehyde ferredoxin oxidoreductase C-terminal domain-containing protein, partial [Promethearchaeota archaeon]